MSIGGEKDFTTARLKKVKFYFLTEKKGAGYSDHPVLMQKNAQRAEKNAQRAENSTAGRKRLFSARCAAAEKSSFLSRKTIHEYIENSCFITSIGKK